MSHPFINGRHAFLCAWEYHVIRSVFPQMGFCNILGESLLVLGSPCLFDVLHFDSRADP
jgi:hypothetical protein